MLLLQEVAVQMEVVRYEVKEALVQQSVYSIAHRLAVLALVPESRLRRLALLQVEGCWFLQQMTGLH